MPRFFVRAEQVCDGMITIFGDDAHHISRSLRMSAGERITICDMQKKEYLCELTDFLPDCVKASVLEIRQSDTEPPFFATVYQALPKGDKLDSIIQKAVECGASSVVPFESERCIVRVKDGAEEKKTERRLRIAFEAAKQCGRGVLPDVLPTMNFAKALEEASKADLALFCYEGDQTESLPTVLQKWRTSDTVNDGIPNSISIMVGSEGGFSLAEKQKAIEMGMIPIGLGKRILRTETAASFVLACLVYEFELAKGHNDVL